MLELCEENAIKNSATKILKINVTLGVLSGIEPTLLKSAFDTFKDEGIAKDAELLLDIKEVLLKCDECSYEYRVENENYNCPKCNSTSYKIIEGEEMHLMSLEME